MSYRVLPLSLLLLICAVVGSASAQTEPADTRPDEVVYGRSYPVPAVKVHLTDIETGGPFAERDIKFKYCWGWDVLKKTPETDRMPSLMCKEVAGRTEKDGTAVLPTWLFTPWRPVAPEGAEFSAPRFRFAGILVRSERHDTYLSAFDAEVNLLDEDGEVRRTVRPYARPKKTNE